MATVSDGEARMPAAADLRTQLTVGLATIAMSVLLVAPRASPFMLLLLLVALGLWWSDRGLRREMEVWPAVIGPCAAFGSYLLLNALWSFDVLQGLGKAALFLALAAGVWLAAASLGRVPAGVLSRLASAILIAFGVGVAYLLFEELSNHLVKRTLFNLLPALRPDRKHIFLDGEMVSNIALYVSNRNMAVANIVLWPLLLACVSLIKGARGTLMAAGLWLVVLIATAHSQHDSSMIAALVSPLVFLLARARPRAAFGLLAIGWTLATLLVVPIVSQAYQAKLYTDKRLPMSAQHRVILWGYTAEQVPKAFMLGVGIDSTKPIDAAKTHEQPADHNYPRRTGTHAHNNFLQAWYELGAIGAGLFLAFGLGLLAGIWRLESAVRPYAAAAFSTGAVLAAFAWGMWQPWYMAMLATAALLMLITAELWRRLHPAR